MNQELLHYILVFSVALTFYFLVRKRLPFASSASVFLIGIFVFYTGSPSNFILESNLKTNISYELLVQFLLKGLLVGSVGFLGLYMADLVSSILSSYFTVKNKITSLRECGFFLGLSLFVSYGGLSQVWELTSSNNVENGAMLLLRETIIPLGSLVFISALSACLSIFLISLGFDFLLITFRKMLDYNLGSGSHQSIRICVLALFLSSTFYVFSEEMSNMIAFNDLFIEGK